MFLFPWPWHKSLKGSASLEPEDPALLLIKGGFPHRSTQRRWTVNNHEDCLCTGTVLGAFIYTVLGSCHSTCEEAPSTEEWEALRTQLCQGLQVIEST
jgi:hypothetical protein